MAESLETAASSSDQDKLEEALAKLIPRSGCTVLDGDDAFELKFPCHRQLAKKRFGDQAILQCMRREVLQHTQRSD
jgi:hypothetical protein